MSSCCRNSRLSVQCIPCAHILCEQGTAGDPGHGTHPHTGPGSLSKYVGLTLNQHSNVVTHLSAFKPWLCSRKDPLPCKAPETSQPPQANQRNWSSLIWTWLTFNKLPDWPLSSPLSSSQDRGHIFLMCHRHRQTNLPKPEQDCKLEELLSHRDQLLYAKVPQ